PRIANLLGCGCLLVLLAACGGTQSPASAHTTIGARSADTDRGPGGPGVPLGPRTELTRGACISYAGSRPTSPTVFIDAGHGGIDTGAVTFFNGTYVDEKTLNLAVARDLAVRLHAAGDRVVLARTGDTAVARLRPGYMQSSSYTARGARAEIQARVDCANAARAQLLLAIHFDAFYDPYVGGTETLYDGARPFAARNRRLARLVQQALVSAFHRRGWQVPDRGAQPDSTAGTPALTAQGAAYGHLLELGPAVRTWFNRASRMPGVVVEPVFISNDAEVAIATSRQGQQIMAMALARAISEYFTPTMARRTPKIG
ncbi:MAG TPA: N-acetylmuramoyl-L-alanine amidase, partial [Chloroflexota bacterium]|nr:N-acetylmuramoyl-L-alanine amidase [Chloroflexota bacterium]